MHRGGRERLFTKQATAPPCVVFVCRTTCEGACPLSGWLGGVRGGSILNRCASGAGLGKGWICYERKKGDVSASASSEGHPEGLAELPGEGLSQAWLRAAVEQV